MHSFRGGCSITLSVLEVPLADIARYVGWKSTQMAQYCYTTVKRTRVWVLPTSWHSSSRYSATEVQVPSCLIFRPRIYSSCKNLDGFRVAFVRSCPLPLFVIFVVNFGLDFLSFGRKIFFSLRLSFFCLLTAVQDEQSFSPHILISIIHRVYFEWMWIHYYPLPAPIMKILCYRP